jgi:hypothetical protein
MAITFIPKPAIGFCTQPFVDAHGNGGYAYTLTQKLGEYLREAERRHGQRNMEWTILGIEFSGTIPHVWFPYTEKLVSVMLTESAALDPNRALFQLAHEVVHLLEPSPLTPTTVFEEGLATMFSHEICTREQIAMHSDIPSYLAAEAALKDLLAIYPDAVRTIRKVIRRPFVDLTSDEILQAVPDAPLDLAKTLAEKFAR